MIFQNFPNIETVFWVTVRSKWKERKMNGSDWLSRRLFGIELKNVLCIHTAHSRTMSSEL